MPTRGRPGTLGVGVGVIGTPNPNIRPETRQPDGGPSYLAASGYSSCDLTRIVESFATGGAMRRICAGKLILWATTVCAVACGSMLARPAGAPEIAITGATVIDGNGGAPIPDAVIVVSGGKIAEFGPRTKMKLPTGVTVIDASGRYI